MKREIIDLSIVDCVFGVLGSYGFIVACKYKKNKW